jgi:cellulose synthase/poly-beta-1,6-N-acetylglucosamine synthase-like glycosyltransferase
MATYRVTQPWGSALETSVYRARGSARGPRRRRRAPRWARAAGGRDGRQAFRPLVVLLALAPVLYLLVRRLHHVPDAPLLAIYGALSIGTTGLVMYLAFARYRDPSTARPMTSERPLATVLVAVKDEIDVIHRCVQSLLESTYRPLEFIVVDDGSTDGTREALRELEATEPGLKVLYMDASAGKKRALTEGVRHANGRFLIFTDSDCVMAHDAIEHVMNAFASDPEIGAISGHGRALNADHNVITRMQDTWYEGQFSVWKAAESSLGTVTCISGPLAAFRREAIYNYFPAWANDTFLGKEFRFATDRQLTGYVLGNRHIGEKLKARHAGDHFVTSENHPTREWRVEYVKAARVWTMVPPTTKKLMRQQARWKKSFLRNLCFTGRFYWRKGLGPAALFYAHAIFVLATPIMAFRHLVWLPAHGEWSLVGIYFCGLFLKGSVWAIAYKVENPHCNRWVYRPLMSLMSAVCFSMILPWSALTVRRGVWARG